MSQDLKIITVLFILIMSAVFVLFGEKKQVEQEISNLSDKVNDLKEINDNENENEKENYIQSTSRELPSKPDNLTRPKPPDYQRTVNKDRKLVARGYIMLDENNLCDITNKEPEVQIIPYHDSSGTLNNNSEYVDCVLNIYDLENGYHTLAITVDHLSDLTTKKQLYIRQDLISYIDIQLKY